MPASSIILIGVCTPAFGIAGCFVWSDMQRRNGWSNKTVMILLAACLGIVPIYGCIGLLDVFERAGFRGLTSPGEVYGLAVFFGGNFNIHVSFNIEVVHAGFMYGAFQEYARDMYNELVPNSEKEKWGAFFSITDRV